MADSKVSALASASPADGTEQIHVNDSGVSKKLTVNNLKTYISATGMQGSTFGNLTRHFRMRITGQGSSQIKCRIFLSNGRGFNASSNMSTTESAAFGLSGNASVGSGATAVTFALNGSGHLTITFAETVTNASAVVDNSSTGTVLSVQCGASGGALNPIYLNASSGAIIDLSTIGSTQVVEADYKMIVGGAE